MYRYSTDYRDEIFIERLETGSGDEHPFLGFVLNRDDVESITLDPHEGVLPKSGTTYDPIHITTGNLLYIPDLPEDDDIYYVIHIYGGGGNTVEVKPKSNIISGQRYHITFSDVLDEEGVYESITKNNRLMDVPSVAPISDYYLGKQLGRSEEFLVDML